MSDKFESLDANEKAALESTLYRCRALAGRIGEELRKKKPEHRSVVCCATFRSRNVSGRCRPWAPANKSLAQKNKSVDGLTAI